MALYYYKAKGFDGEEVSGTLNTDNKYSVASRLKARGLVPIRIKEINTNSLSYAIKASFNKIGSKELAAFCKQFGALLEAGVKVTESLNFIAKQTSNTIFSNILSDINWQINAGYSLADALKNYPYVFSELFVSMVETGEASGNLSSVLKLLSDYYSYISIRKEKIKNAMTYPTLLGVVSSIVVIFLTIKVLPVYVNIFTSYGAKLPKATQLLLWMNSHLGHIACASFILFLMAYSMLLWSAKSEKTSYMLDRLKLSIPVIGHLLIKNELCRVIRVLNILVSSGIPILKALEIAGSSAKNRFIRVEIDKIKFGLKQGNSLSELFNHKTFPPIMAKMIATGEESGKLEEMLDKVATIYEHEVDIMLERLISLVEPVVLIILTVIISFIVISILMPMFEIYNLL